MRVKFLFFQILLLASGALAQTNPTADLNFIDVENMNAFWLKKSQLQKEILENRRVVVSVTEPKESQWEFKGVGLIQAPVDSCWRQAYEVEKLGLVSKYIKNLKYDSKSGRLQFGLAVLNKVIEIVAYIKYIPDHKKIHLSVLEGPYHGLRGVIQFKDIERLKTESVFFAKYQKKSSMVPDWLFSFSIEAVMHQVASALRDMVEHDHKVTGK